MSPPAVPPSDTPDAHRTVAVLRIEGDSVGSRGADDAVVVEEPLEVRLGDRSLLVTMRTPGHDLDLVRGLLFTEGLVADPGDVAGVAFCRDVPREARGNVVTVSLREGVELDDEGTLRATLVSSGCGICGRATLDSLQVSCPPTSPGPALTRELIEGLPGAMRGAQSVFERTGGLHAAALFGPKGRLLSLREDVGRHNAVDKVIGEALRFGRLPLHDTLLMLSGRAGFEIVQKARRAGIPVVASVSAPSSLAVEVAREGQQTLVGFVRGDRFNVYTGAERFQPPLTAPSP